MTSVSPIKFTLQDVTACEIVRNEDECFARGSANRPNIWTEVAPGYSVCCPATSFLPDAMYTQQDKASLLQGSDSTHR